MNVKIQYVKIKTPKGKVWIEVLFKNPKINIPIIEKGKIKGKCLLKGKTIFFRASDVIAFYTGKLSDIVGLGMPYIPTAEVCTILDTIVPDSMAYETHIACRMVQEIIGKPLSTWVAERLHYTELELCKALSAEQVDAVSLCIYNIEYKNQGMIIGDQTGIGKGRVAASMIRYGYYNNLKPIFLSEKPNLFSDIYRDLSDIGSKNLIPFIVNGKEAKTDIKDGDGNIIYQALPPTEQQKIFKDQKFPKNYDFACATYSQFNSSKEKPTKPNFLRAIANENLLIMDESHNASGSSNTGEFLQDVIKTCKGVVFLSATFAKRPDNMPVYAMKTCLSEANMTKEELIEAIIKGGVALQEIISAELVSEGQMIRRERSFEGVEVNYIVLTDKETEHKAIFDNITSVIRDIIVFQTEHVNPVVKQMDKIAVAEGAQIEERKGTSKAGVDNAPYFSKVFQVINQILFSLKARSVAEIAIQRLEEGKKPIIAFSSTMESFLDDMTNEQGNPLMPGDTLNVDFKTVLKKGLDGVMRYTVTDAMGKRQGKYFGVSELNQDGQKFYYSILEKINKISTGISISPIDVIKDIIRKSGYTCDEITGRGTELQLIEGTHNAVMLNRKKLYANDAFRLYNNNELDCLLINQSGSTGASGHAIVTSRVPKEKVKQRVMIILQPELDINREVQKRGRINRTGQIMKPIYDYVTSCIPAENRLMMMLRKKLKSLDANTTSNQKQSDNILNVEDFLNKYGDKVVTEYLQENKELNEMLGDPLGMEKEEKESTVTENAASKVSGRVAVLSIEQQEKFYTDILERYADFINYLKQADIYDLEVQELNLQAQTIDEQTVVQGTDGKSVFSENSILEKCQVNVLKKPFTVEELKNILTENLQGRNGKEIQSEVIEQAKTFYANRLAMDIEKVEKKYDKLIEDIPNEKGYAIAPNQHYYIEDRTRILNNARIEAIERENELSENKFYNISSILHFYYPGKVVNYPTLMNQAVKGLCLGYNIDKRKDNPYAPSSIKIKIAVASTDKYIDLTLSGEPGKKLMEIMGYSTYIQRSEQDGIFDNWTYYCRNSSGSRREAFIITGNILQALGKKYTGKLISYTTMEGSIKKGLLLPENFDPTKQGRGMIIVPIGKAIDYIKSMSEDTYLYASDDKIVLQRYSEYNEDRSYCMMLPANKQYKDMFEDRSIIKLCSNNRDGFEKRGNQMVAYFNNQVIKPLVEHLQEKYSLSVQLSPAVFDQFIEQKKTIKSAKNNLVEKAEKQYNIDKSNFDSRKNSTPAMPKKIDNLALLKLKLKLKAKALELMTI